MSEHTLPNKAIVSKITPLAMQCFRSFGGGQESVSLLSDATKDGPPIFALGVNISEVVTMVLTMAGYEDVLDACEALLKVQMDCSKLHQIGCKTCDYCLAHEKAKAVIENVRPK